MLAGLMRAMLLLLLAGTGCVDPYLRAVSRFGQTFDAAGGVLTRALDESDDLCHERIDLSYLADRLVAPTHMPGGFGGAPARYKFDTDEASGPPGTKQSWSAYCGAIGEASTVERTAINLMRGYAAVLVGVVDRGAYNGWDFNDAAANSSAIAKKFAGYDNPYASGVGGAGAFLTKFADFLFRQIVAKKLRNYVNEGDPILTAALSGIRKWLDAAGTMQLAEADRQLRTVLIEAEDAIGVSPQKPDPLRGLTFYDFAASWELRMHRHADALKALDALAAAMQAAHHALRDRDFTKLDQALGAMYAQMEALRRIP
jgi:hypothetical protein